MADKFLKEKFDYNYIFDTHDSLQNKCTCITISVTFPSHTVRSPCTTVVEFKGSEE